MQICAFYKNQFVVYYNRTSKGKNITSEIYVNLTIGTIGQSENNQL